VAVDRPGDGHGCQGSVSHRQAVAKLVSAVRWRWLRRARPVTCAGPGSRSRLPLLHRRPASTRFSTASMPQRICGM
jgi:hypothetical protein